jgi:hypothetical protein
MRASGTLARLAAGLKAAEDAAGPNLLDQLIKAEQRAAALLKDLQRQGSPANQAMARAETKQFGGELGSLTRKDGELAAAANQLSKSQKSTSFNAQRPDAEPPSPGSPQFATSPTNLVDALREVDVILQRRIQQAIVSGTMQQAVGAVPPEYTDMVDDYYRTLSEDIE